MMRDTLHGPAASALAAQPSADAPLITLSGATVRFGAQTALRDIHLCLRRGERLALVGPNGSGKTTLLRLLHGLAGHEGQRQAHQPVVAAMLFQHPFLLRLSARRNLLLALWLRRVPPSARRARADEALQRVGQIGRAHV